MKTIRTDQRITTNCRVRSKVNANGGVFVFATRKVMVQVNRIFRQSLEQNALQISSVKRNSGNIFDWQSGLIESLAGVILPANLLDHAGMRENFFANTEFEQDTQRV